MPKPKHVFSTKDAEPVERAFPGNPPSSPNAPANMDAAAAKGAAEVLALRAAHNAKRAAVARGDLD